MAIEKLHIPSPLALEGWLEFNRLKWGLQPLQMRFSEKGRAFPAVEAILYLDEKGHVRMPAMNPYLPVAFFPTPATLSSRLERQWLSVSGLMAEECRRRGLASSVSFPPQLTDVREWQWRGFIASVRYTFYLELPIDERQIDSSVRNKINKATRNGFICQRGASLPGVFSCLKETEERQRFSHSLSLGDLQLLYRLLGEETFRCYVCYAPNGEVASTRIILFRNGARAVDWVAGTKQMYLTSGATQYLTSFVLDDLSEAGAKGFDYAGANIRTVAAAKAAWGGQLVPSYVTEQPRLKGIAKYAINYWRFKRGG